MVREMSVTGNEERNDFQLPIANLQLLIVDFPLLIWSR
jgi:hypothetical protein